MDVQFSIQKFPADIRRFRAHGLTRNFRFFRTTPREGVLLIAGFLCLSLLILVSAALARAAQVTLGPDVANPSPLWPMTVPDPPTLLLLISVGMVSLFLNKGVGAKATCDLSMAYVIGLTSESQE
jgi:hypothetical protein